MKFPRTTRIIRGQIDAAPFAAVFFLLVIFLMLQSSFVFTPGVALTLPEAVDLPGTPHPTTVVAVDAAGIFYFENEACGEERLGERLRKAVAAASGQPLTLVIQADQSVHYHVLVRLGAVARQAGIKEALLATKPPVAPGPPLPNP